MCIRDGKSVDHALVLDGERRQIIDREEKKPMVLSVEALKACAGGDAVNLYIEEVSELLTYSRVDNASLLLN